MNSTANKNIADCYAVFGNPISHSKSPVLQMAFAQQTQQHIVYTAELIGVNEFKQQADKFFSNNGKGLNVTVPFKLAAFNYADQLTSRAQKAGAVNTLIKKDNSIIGDNTDGIGLVTDILENLAWTLKDKNILVLGAGGAVRGIIEPLILTQAKQIVIANRTVEKAHQLVNLFCDTATKNSIEILASHFTELDGKNFDIIINGTSTSLQGKLPDLPDHLTHKDSACYDMMYSKESTVFMQWAQQQGVQHIADGLGMLVCQGAESFFAWRNIKPETKTVINSLRQQL